MAQKERSASMWILILGAAAAVAVVLLAGEGWVKASLERERSMNRGFYGEATSEAAEARATRWFVAHYVNSGFQAATFDTFTRAAETPTQGIASPFDSSGRMLAGMFESRLRAFWTLLFQAYVRASHVALWLPYLGLVLVPLLVDALVTRVIRKHTYDFVSPLQHHFAAHGVQIIAVGLLALAVVPFPTPAALIPILLAAAGVLFHRVIANYVKHA